MFWKNAPNITRTLAFRLTVGYGGIAFLFALIAFGVFYVKLAAVTFETMDDELAEEIDELAEVWSQEGLSALKEQIAEENLEEDFRHFYFSLFDAKGVLLASTDLPKWAATQLSPEMLTRVGAAPGNRTRQTVDTAGDDLKGRIITVRLAPQLILQHGQSIQGAQEYLEIFQQLFWIVVSVSLLLAGACGWFMAGRALKGVAEVTRTATLISQGRFQERVRMQTPYEEIKRLAGTFNIMVDRVQDLIERMREITDNIAHDLRSPLTRIRGIAEMSLISKTGALTPSQAAENTIEECDNLIEMINTMLDLTEIEAGVQKLELADLDISQLLEEAWDLFRPLALERGIELRLQVETGLHIRTDRSGLQRIVYNLTENALKYSRRGDTVSLDARMRDRQVVITVQDTGIGISSNDLPYIFDRFYRTDQSRTQPGNGLGLSLVKAITTALGGNVVVDSRPNAGSAFLVNLPGEDLC
ncbi:MAG: HAMP domain-containing sensor histidine kinase [Desulfobacterales bacterium]